MGAGKKLRRAGGGVILISVCGTEESIHFYLEEVEISDFTN